MHIAVINRAAEGARRAGVLRQCPALALEPAPVDAVEGGGLPRGELQKLCLPDLTRRLTRQPLTAGEVGCNASQIAVRQALLAPDRAPVAVSADDVARSPGAWSTIRSTAGAESAR